MTQVRPLSGMVGIKAGSWHNAKREPIELPPPSPTRPTAADVEEIEEVESPRVARDPPCSGCGGKLAGTAHRCDPCKKIWCPKCVPRAFERGSKRLCKACDSPTCCADWFENPACDKCTAVYCRPCVTDNPSERLGTDVRKDGKTERLCGTCARKRARRDSKRAAKRSKEDRVISEVSEFIDESLAKKREASRPSGAGSTLEDQTQPWRCELPQCVICLAAGASVKRARTAHAVNVECGHAIFCIDCSLSRKNLVCESTEASKPCPVRGCASFIGEIVVIRNAVGVRPH